MSRRPTLHGTVLLVAGSVSCTATDAPSPEFAVRDSAGISIAESASPLLPERLVLRDSTALVIPGDFGAPTHYFEQPEYALENPDGSVVVGDQGSRRLYWFSPDGELLGQAGGPGEGPGEVQAVYGLERCGADAMVVEEVRRLSVFGNDGEFRATVPITGHLTDFRAPILGADRNCTKVLLQDDVPLAVGPDAGVVDLPGVIYWATFADGARDTVASIVRGQAQPWTLDGRVGLSRVPFGRSAVFAVHDERVYVGEGRVPELHVFEATGQTRRIRWNAPSLAITDEDWDHFEESYADFLREYPEERDLVPALESYVRPDFRPAYASMRVDGAGRVWLQHYGSYGPFSPDPSSEWTVIGADGRWLAEVTLPEGLTVLTVGGRFVIGLVRDQLDVPEVRVYPLPPDLP